MFVVSIYNRREATQKHKIFGKFVEAEKYLKKEQKKFLKCGLRVGGYETDNSVDIQLYALPKTQEWIRIL